LRDMNVMVTSLFVAMLAGAGESCPSSGCTQGGDLASDGTIVAQVAGAAFGSSTIRHCGRLEPNGPRFTLAAGSE